MSDREGIGNHDGQRLLGMKITGDGIWEVTKAGKGAGAPSFSSASISPGSAASKLHDPEGCDGDLPGAPDVYACLHHFCGLSGNCLLVELAARKQELPDQIRKSVKPRALSLTVAKTSCYRGRCENPTIEDIG